MEGRFHELVPVIVLDQIPHVKDWFIQPSHFTVENLQHFSTVPDIEDKDNIENDALCRHGHSYKLVQKNNGQLKWLDGDCLNNLRSCCMSARSFHKENRDDLCREQLARASHYLIDSMTFPHLHYGKPWTLHHASFEYGIAKFLERNQERLLVNLSFDISSIKDVYKFARVSSLILWHDGMVAVGLLEAKKEIPEVQRVLLIRNIAQAVGNLFLFVLTQLKIIPNLSKVSDVNN